MQLCNSVKSIPSSGAEKNRLQHHPCKSCWLGAGLQGAVEKESTGHYSTYSALIKIVGFTASHYLLLK